MPEPLAKSRQVALQSLSDATISSEGQLYRVNATVAVSEVTNFQNYRVTSIEELERLKSERPLCGWGELLKCDPKNTFFQGPSWVGEWYHAYRDGFDPLIIVVTRGDELMGVVPLAVEKGTRRVAFAGDQMADYRDILSHPAGRGEVVRALLRVLREGYFSNMLRVGPMLPESDTADIMLPMVRQEGVWGIRRSHFGGFWDVVMRVRGKWPFRCRSCRVRFHQTAAAPPD